MKTTLLLSLVCTLAFFTMGQDGGSGCATGNNGGIAGTGLHGKITTGATVDPNDPTHVVANVGGEIDFARRPLTSGERAQIHDAAFQAGAAWFASNPQADERKEKAKLTDKFRYHYRVPWKTIRPLVESAWEEGARSAGEPVQTSFDPDRLFRENALKATHL